MTYLTDLRERVRQARCCDQNNELKNLISKANLDQTARRKIEGNGVELVKSIRSRGTFGLLEEFFKEYGLSTKEGLALMSLAEALMRIPDTETKDALIEDKIATSSWSSHFGHSGSSLINISTLGLMAAGSILEKSSNSFVGALHEVVKRLGEPVIRVAMSEAMKFLGERFVLGQDIEQAIQRSEKPYTYSYDMLGEAAHTQHDADKYFEEYTNAIKSISKLVTGEHISNNPGISVKLSALHPRYEYTQRDRVINELTARVSSLTKLACEYNLGINIDAEEIERLDLSLDIIEQVIANEDLKGWAGFGVVVQAYSPCAAHVIDWLYALAGKYDRRIMVRLVKGAYWDTEIKRAQTLGLEQFPVYTRKAATDVSYIACARKLVTMTGSIYPQFATHNAHTASAVLYMVRQENLTTDQFEFQRLHGMGQSLHETIMQSEETRCRIYAPVGIHKDLLAYLVRRLLENGANSSFINQIVDESFYPEDIAQDPFEVLDIANTPVDNPKIRQPTDLYRPGRYNSFGWDLTDNQHVQSIQDFMNPFRTHQWSEVEKEEKPVVNPANSDEVVGYVKVAGETEVEQALSNADRFQVEWSSVPAPLRAEYLRNAANLFESESGEIFALLVREAGKTLEDCVAELREAVDFLRYYASEAERLGHYGSARGIVSCISPWNFPLAIFTGQIAGALAAGNVVLAKPAEVTPLIATKAVSLMHRAGIPKDALQLLIGSGSTVGHRITSDERVAGVCFTGSLDTAQRINKAMAQGVQSDAMLIAETGGLNAMIVDSTALPEQVVTDIIASAFQSAGQRCSALRMLYIQEDFAENLLDMLYGAMDELVVGDPWDTSTDIGPVIDESARQVILEHISAYENKVLKNIAVPENGYFVPPTVIQVSGINELQEEIFGPVLHVATYKEKDLGRVIEDINARGYGLTFGLHTRIGEKMNFVSSRIKAGNIYINRNQIGAIVESQPFGGEGLSGTGPKAGGPRYVQRFRSLKGNDLNDDPEFGGQVIELSVIQSAINSLSAVSEEPIETTSMSGPTGETNTLMTLSRGKILCLGPGDDLLQQQISAALEFGCSVLAITLQGYLHPQTDVVAEGKLAVLEGEISPDMLGKLDGISAVSFWGKSEDKRLIRKSLSERQGALVPLISETCGPEVYVLERHVCVNTAAAGGDTSLFAL